MSSEWVRVLEEEMEARGGVRRRHGGAHIFTRRSLLPEASVSPAGAQSSAYTSSACPASVYSATGLTLGPTAAAGQTLMVLSFAALAR